MTQASILPLESSYARLPERFFARLSPTPVSAPRLIRLNRGLARELGLDVEALETGEGARILGGNQVPAGAEPLAMAYAGFQFGNWVPQLGDGRAILLGELIHDDGIRRDVQLKGSGPTPFSRRGDGRAGMGPVLREYVVGEAMAALGVPTTRALAVVATGDTILRETEIPGAILTRIAKSHVRVGTFQYFAGHQDVEGIRTLADHVIARHYPGAREEENPYLALLQAVVDRQADLVSRWQGLGFIHGVMNTDNMSIAGETIDYGPCAYMDSYHPETVYSSIDQMGRYAYCNQPPIAHWNLAGLAQALLPILGDHQETAVEQANHVLQSFPERFDRLHRAVFRRKLGLGEDRAENEELIQGLLSRMAEGGADFTLTFRRLADCVEADPPGEGSPRSLFQRPEAFDEWAAAWREWLAAEGRPHAQVRAEMRTVNPVYIPRNHLVEEIIRAAVDEDDFAPFEQLVEVLGAPFDDQPGRERYAEPPRPEQIVHQTFCGT